MLPRVLNKVWQLVIAFRDTARCGLCYVRIPTGWEDWPDAKPEDSFRRYETLVVAMSKDHPRSWEPSRPCLHRWKYDGRKQIMAAACCVCVHIGKFDEWVQLNAGTVK